MISLAITSIALADYLVKSGSLNLFVYKNFMSIYNFNLVIILLNLIILLI